MSGERGNVRKIFDVPGTSITSNNTYSGSGAPTTAWSSGLLIPTNNGMLWLTDLGQGVQDNSRVGISVALETFDFKCRITPDATVANQTVRMLIVADNECDGTQPLITEVLGDSFGTAVAINSGLMMSYLQPAYFGRFQVIEDKVWHFNSAATGTGANSGLVPQTHPLWHESHHDMKGHRVMWDTTDASAQTNARKGHIFVFFLYESFTTATGGLPTQSTANPPSIHLAARFRFTDA